MEIIQSKLASVSAYPVKLGAEFRYHAYNGAGKYSHNLSVSPFLTRRKIYWSFLLHGTTDSFPMLCKLEAFYKGSLVFSIPHTYENTGFRNPGGSWNPGFRNDGNMWVSNNLCCNTAYTPTEVDDEPFWYVVGTNKIAVSPLRVVTMIDAITFGGVIGVPIDMGGYLDYPVASFFLGCYSEVNVGKTYGY